MHGFCHIEIPTTNLEKSRQFYEQVFDWELDEMSEMNYTVFKTPEGPGGGFQKVDSIPDEPVVLNYIEVEDIEETLDKIAQHGGDILDEKSEVGSFSFQATFADPCGVVLGLWEATESDEDE